MPIPTTWAALFRATYDAWGKQTVTQNTIGFHRGYTGHEHLPEFGLIDMNGRMYDPLLGRFLSPDNYVQLPDFSQNFNRYSYCLNNPLIYTDPSGELIGELIYIAAMAYFGGVQANFMHAANNGGNPFNPGNWNWKSPWTYIGMASSGLGAYSQIGGLNGFATETSSLSNLFELPKDPVLLAYANDGGPGKVRLLQNGVLEAKYSLGTVYVYGRDLSKVAAITQKIHQGHTAFLNHPVTQFALAVLPIVPAVGGIRTVSIASKAARPVTQFAAKTGVEALQYTKSSLSLGREMHAAYKLAEHAPELGRFKEFGKISGIRPDFVDFSTKTIYELKPFNPRAIQQGVLQLNKYQSIFEQRFGGIWKTVLDTY